MTTAQHIAEAMELYGESAVSDLIAKDGNYQDIISFFDIQVELELLKMAKYETHDGISFKKRRRTFLKAWRDN